MNRKIICTEHQLRPTPLEDVVAGWKFRTQIATVTAPMGQSLLKCDLCGAEIPNGTQARLTTNWMSTREGEPDQWEKDYIQEPIKVNDPPPMTPELSKWLTEFTEHKESLRLIVERFHGCTTAEWNTAVEKGDPKAICRILNNAWINAPDDPSIHSIHGWGVLCDLCSDYPMPEEDE